MKKCLQHFLRRAGCELRRAQQIGEHYAVVGSCSASTYVNFRDIAFAWRKFLACAAALLWISGASAAPPAVPSDSAPPWDAALADIDQLFTAFAAEHHVPGLVYGVVRDGKLVHVHSIGVQDIESKLPVTADTSFRIASMTKSFTALAVLRLRDEGRLSLDMPVTKLVPEVRVIPKPGDAAHPIRLRQLLTHTAGFVTDDPWGDRQLDMSDAAFTRFLKAGIPLVREPGEAFDYSNTGYAILGRAITRASHRRYQDYISQTILEPLGMRSTVWEYHDIPIQHAARGYSWVDDHYEAQPALGDGAYGAMGGLSSTANDYARYVAWLLSAWQADARRIPGTMAPATVREIGRAAVLSQVGERASAPDGKPCPVVWMYGAGFNVVSDCELGTMMRHPGGLPGFGSQVLLLPQFKLGIFAFANLTYAHLSDPVVDAAARLKRAGLLSSAAGPLSPALQNAATVALRMYQSGDVGALQAELSANVLLDRSVARRDAEIRRYREQIGACTSIAPLEILHPGAGRFSLACEHGTLGVAILLAPTSAATIQYLEFTLTSPPSTPQ